MRTGVKLSLVLVVLLAPGWGEAAVTGVDDGVLFSHTDAAAQTVHLAGAFNDWNTTATPMANDGAGTWSVVVPLEPGTHEYKFVVNGSTWLADPDNPRTGGDYGNSVVEIGADGQIVSGGGGVALPVSGTPVLSNNTLNSRVYLGGFFRMIMEGASDVDGDNRLRLQRPDDEFNLDVTANLSDKLWGTIRLQLETGRGGANELETELYKAQSNFIDEDFQVQAYYNEEVYQTDEPFELLGHIDLRGTIREEHRPFGQGTQGVVFRAAPWGSDFSLLVADTFDEDIFNFNRPTVREGSVEDRGLNQNTGTDLVALRWTRPVASTNLGLTYRGIFSDWWVDFTKEANAYPAAVQAHRDAQIRNNDSDKSDNFEIANDEHAVALDVGRPLDGLFDGLSTRAAAGYRWYDARWNVGNREELQGQGFDDGVIDIPIGNERGLRGELQLGLDRGGLRANVSHEIRYGEGMDPGEAFVTYRTGSGSIVSDRDPSAISAEPGAVDTFNDINQTDALDVLFLGPRPEQVGHLTEVDLAYDFDRFTLELEFELDRNRDNLSYQSFLGAASATFDRWAWRASPRLTWRPFDSAKHFVSLESELLDFEDPTELEEVGASRLDGAPGQGTGSLLRVQSTEVILRGNVPVGKLKGKGLSFNFDLRFVSYEGPNGLVARNPAAPNDDDAVLPLDLDGDFFNPFVALAWEPADAVRVQLGYGIDPVFYDVISPEGWPNGREQFRERWLADRRLVFTNPDGKFGYDPSHPANVLLAEQALEDRVQFVANVLVRF